MSVLSILTYLRKSRLKVFAKPGIVFFLIPFLTMNMMAPQQSGPSEYQVKAVFLYNFTQFVEWPSFAFENQDSPLVLGILGKDPFGNYLDETVSGDSVNGHPLVVQRFQNAEDVGKCHILFISASEKDRLKGIVQLLESRNILTVSDAANFTKYGGIVRFYTENHKTRISINLESAKKADLTISSKLLRLAEIVNPENN
jgi:hypothetical protein